MHESKAHGYYYSCKKFFPYDLTHSQNTSVTDDDGRTEWWTYDNHTNSSIVTWVRSAKSSRKRL